jgi:acyl carrier protein
MPSQVQVTLGALWSEILRVDNVSPDSDFFALGGDSILVMTMLFRVEEELGVYLDPGVMFSSSTLAEFADEVDRARDSANQSAPVAEA